MLTLPFFYLLTLSRATFEIPVCHHYGLMVLPRLVAFQIISYELCNCLNSKRQATGWICGWCDNATMNGEQIDFCEHGMCCGHDLTGHSTTADADDSSYSLGSSSHHSSSTDTGTRDSSTTASLLSFNAV